MAMACSGARKRRFRHSIIQSFILLSRRSDQPYDVSVYPWTAQNQMKQQFDALLPCHSGLGKGKKEGPSLRLASNTFNLDYQTTELLLGMDSLEVGLSGPILKLLEEPYTSRTIGI